jgi:hypothetical protein
MLVCWKCNTQAAVRETGWECPGCGQIGPPTPPTAPPNALEGEFINSPYESPAREIKQWEGRP